MVGGTAQMKTDMNILLSECCISKLYVHIAQPGHAQITCCIFYTILYGCDGSHGSLTGRVVAHLCGWRRPYGHGRSMGGV